MEAVISMGKEFWKSIVSDKYLWITVLISGSMISIILGIGAYQATELPNQYELVRNSGVDTAYEQELIAGFDNQKISLNVMVEERVLTKEEAEAELKKAAKILPEILKGINQSLSQISSDLNFVDMVPDTKVEVCWTEKQTEYFSSDGKIKETISLATPVELELSAILTCYEYAEDFSVVITLLPREKTLEEQLLETINILNAENMESEIFQLPESYEGKMLSWRKPLDLKFLYFFILTVVSALALKFGKKKDLENARKQRVEAFEKEYAQIVSKFAMLLSAGLSIRNAWERIVLMQKRKGDFKSAVYEELYWGFKEMQKGVSELEVYEKFGFRVQEIHYKKLMALFILEKKRGSVPLLEAMKQEMLSAWDEQKRKTRQQGERIGTKLLLPMMGMLGVVFIIIMVPAFLSFT